ncbi:hypothetical protein PRIPAC_74700 [Pristionchus pacificus]|uniref:Uncharacterized protein n=1 Tax=Pristionchus pacificus TaxID=54126 RepID=A0A2A6C227_PRIPA|nr:hypothetical protein PRIPAC_74700 [Pristionchus pacificus]|eukprot:PDM72081.1 hypothetical protein PRIPAC_38488 [Pristionchus pacificus]
MFLENYLNRSETDVYWPLFECIYASEIRLRLVGLLLQIGICSLARTVIMYHQELGPVEHAEPTYLIIASIVREAFKGYAVGLYCAHARSRSMDSNGGLVLVRKLDSLFSSDLDCTRMYESQRPSTIAAYIPLECALLLLSWTMSLLLITEIINDQIFVLYLGVVLFSGIVGIRKFSQQWKSVELAQSSYQFQCYYSVLRYNRREVEVFKKGAQIHMYSVSKCYQYRENIAILNVLNLIAGPVALSALPCFAFYSFYSNVPENYGLNFLRFMAAELYDLGSLVFITSLLKSEPKFRQNASEFTVVKQIMMMSGRIANDDSMFKVAPQDPNIYFAMLSRDLG